MSPTLFHHMGPLNALRYGKDPLLDAWILHFLSENHIEYSIDPLRNASPEQIRFMVDLGPEQIYMPCSDAMLTSILEKNMESDLVAAYDTVWKQVVEVIEGYCPSDYDKMKIRALCDHKFRQAVNAPVMIPSRLLKRLTSIILAQSSQDDPYRERKRAFNRRALKFMRSDAMGRILNTCPGIRFNCATIRDMRFELDMLEISRNLCLSLWNGIWERENFVPTSEAVERVLERCPPLDALRQILDPGRPAAMKVLYLADASGGLVFDIQVIRVLLRMGHRVILALKDGFFFDAPTYWDAEDDPVLGEILSGAHLLGDNGASKNQLLKAIKENPFLVISDGSRERLNLYKVSVTFSRAWKEADLVIAKGEQNHRRIMLTSHRFTRDVFCILREPDGTMAMSHKPKPSGIRTFTEQEITAKAEAIIGRMRQERDTGKTIMFYSAIVGSIPHETDTAIAVLNAFVKQLRAKLSGTYIVNPAEHFEEGMDADDLMFMWEKVQRSGLLNVWRFQTYDDIEQTFELLGRPVPPIWAGKDATYSTGCTKEMQIALDVQRVQPELQIIGPNPEKFFRRREYGVGKFFDAAIAAR